MKWIFWKKEKEKRESELLHAVLCLKCCGNCYYDPNICPDFKDSWRVCPNWTWDERTLEMRGKND